jgi:hypothetical protein
MSEPLIEHLIQEQTAAIAVLQRHITTQVTFRLALMDLHKPTIAADQALALSQQEAEHIHELARADRYHQVSARLRQMQAEEQ